MIFSHESPEYIKPKVENGAYLYSEEIVKYIIPNVDTNRNWVTLCVQDKAYNDAIVFIHDNVNTKRYKYLLDYHNLILVCGIRDTMPKVHHFGLFTIYLPLSVKVDNVVKYKTQKTREICYAGRKNKINADLVKGVDRLEDLPHEELLKQMAKYKYVYAVGRTAIEAKIIGCEVLPFDPRYPDPAIFKILDSYDAAKILEAKITQIDGLNL